MHKGEDTLNVTFSAAALAATAGTLTQITRVYVRLCAGLLHILWSWQEEKMERVCGGGA